MCPRTHYTIPYWDVIVFVVLYQGISDFKNPGEQGRLDSMAQGLKVFIVISTINLWTHQVKEHQC